MGDLVVALGERLNVPTWVLLFSLIVLIFCTALVWLLRHKVKLELDEDAGSFWVHFETGRGYRSIVYKLKYPRPFTSFPFWLHDLEIEYDLRIPRAVQIEQVSYLHPDQDPLDEPTPFSRLGKLVIDHQRVLQVIPKAVAREVLVSHESVLPFFPVLKKLRGVTTVVMDISYPRGANLADEVAQIEADILPDEHALRFVIHKDERVAKIQQYRLEYELPDFIRSFDLPPECPPEARLPTRPEDISIVSACAIDRFDRESPNEKNKLDWRFDVTQTTTQIRLRYLKS